MRVGIIGAGPAGLTAAYQLAKAGIEVDVFEASDAVGGMARSITLWDQRVDLGPHRFFSTDLRVNELWLEVIGQDYAMVDRLTRIYYKKKFFHYPLRVGNALFNLGPWEAVRCLASFFKERLFPSPYDGSFEGWVVRQFGRRLFEIFFKEYSEKLWGVPCTELDADFASQRIKKLSLLEALVNAMKSGKGNQHKTLVDRFAYPHQGSGVLYERMAEKVMERGGRIHFNAPVERVLADEGNVRGLRLENGDEFAFDQVISSMPLTLLVQRLPNLPEEIAAHCRALRFRNTTLVFLHVDADGLFPDNWIYVHDPNLQAGRITNFRNWTPELYGDASSSILTLEYWSYDDSPLWGMPDDALIKLAKDEMQRTGLLQSAPILEGKVVRIRRCYPVYDKGYATHIDAIRSYLTSIQNLTVIGRYGAFKYNNQDHSILMGLLAAERLTQDADHQLWDINTDYDQYQESTLITDTGLVRST